MPFEGIPIDVSRLLPVSKIPHAGNNDVGAFCKGIVRQPYACDVTARAEPYRTLEPIRFSWVEGVDFTNARETNVKVQ